MSEKQLRFDATPTLYQKQPAGDLALEDFERLATRRLQVLRTVEDCATHRRRDPQVWIKRAFGRIFEDVAPCDVDRFDAHSHYALRLASCQDKTRQHWFVRNECALLVMRFKDMGAQEKTRFLMTHGLEFPRISTQERQRLKAKLSGVFLSCCEVEKQRKVNSDDYKTFYKVPFERVPGLVAQRLVYLEQGFAYVPKDEVHILVEHHYEQLLTEGMAKMELLWNRRIAHEEEERLVPIIQTIQAQAVAPDYLCPGSQPRLEDIEDIANQHFPLCMKNLFDKVQEQHHLKHNGRLQLQLFLKGIGLKYEETYGFFKAAFEPKTGASEFEKQYGYHIRHNYGLEGARVSYTPYACSKIIGYTPGPGEHAGCPFKTFTQQQLLHVLTQKGIPEIEVEEILKEVKQRGYRRACGLTWQGVIGHQPPAFIEHPNQYYLTSVKARNALRGATSHL